jgi:signal peptidase I
MNINMKTLIKILLLWLCFYSLATSIYLNVTQSERLGYYFAYKWFDYHIGDIVLICLDNTKYSNVLHSLGLGATQNDCPNHMPFLLKRIVATSGDIVRITNSGVYINNNLYKDSKPLGRYKGINLLAQADGVITLKPHEYFLLGETPTSYDSRYFGVVYQQQIYKKASFLKEIH